MTLTLLTLPFLPSKAFIFLSQRAAKVAVYGLGMCTRSCVTSYGILGLSYVSLGHTMMKELTPSRLRENLYRILDHILDTGKPVEIKRKGRRLKIVPEQERKLSLLKPHPGYLNTDPDELVHMDWSHEWRP